MMDTRNARYLNSQLFIFNSPLFHFHAIDPRGLIPGKRNDKALLPLHDLGMDVYGSLLRHAHVDDRAGLPRNIVLVRVGGVCR